jgi:16S rRNA G1207 methylase RsmC
MADRDALAVDYALQNAELNSFTGVEACGSLGYDGITKRDYDLIVSNIPGKAGEPVITYLLREAQFYLKPGGLAAVVVVTPLETLAAKILAETPGVEVILKRDRPGHTVFHYRFTGAAAPVPEKTSFERGIYHRQEVRIKYDKLTYPMQTAYGLPEFDSLSYDTEILLESLKGFTNKAFRRAAVFNPGQGHVPVILWRYFRPQAITLADRDLLALEYSRYNLLQHGCTAEQISLSHRPGPLMEIDSACDLIAGVLPEENKEALQLTLERAAGFLNAKGLLVISGTSTAITRLETYVATRKDLSAKGRERWRGYSVLVMEKP